MENLISKYQDNQTILKGIEKMNLLKEHPKFKVGQIISFFGGNDDDIHFISKITGFDKDGGIYVLWDCFWFPIKDDLKRKIKVENTCLLKSKECSKVLNLMDNDYSYSEALAQTLNEDKSICKQQLEKELNKYI